MTAGRLASRSVAVGVAWGAGLFGVTGVLTLLLPNTLFTRMTPIMWWDFVLWPLAAMLVGAFMGLRDAGRAAPVACATTAGGGGFLAFLGFSCPVCNHLLIFLMGTGGVLTFVQPYRLHIGLLGLGTLLAAVVLMGRAYRGTLSAPPS